MSIRKQRFLTTAEAAKLHDEDTRMELRLQEMQLKAQKEEKYERQRSDLARTS